MLPGDSPWGLLCLATVGYLVLLPVLVIPSKITGLILGALIHAAPSTNCICPSLVFLQDPLLIFLLDPKPSPDKPAISM